FTVVGLIPAGLGRAYHALAAALTGRLDPTPDVAAAGAWTEARWGWKSRRPGPIAVARAAAMSCVPAASVERIRRPMSILPCGAAGEWRIPKCGPGTEIAERGCRKGSHITKNCT